MKKGLFIFLLVYVGLCLKIHSKNYYVAIGGSGSGTIASPYGKISKAASMVSAGDTVFIAGGEYCEMNIKPKTSGTESKIIVFCPWPGTGEVIITKDSNTLTDEESDIFNLTDLGHIWLQGITFKGMKYLKSCINLKRATHCVVTGCKIIANGHEEIATSSDGVSMITMNNSQYCVVSNCYFEKIYGDAVNLVGQNTKNNLISGNTFVDLKGKKRSWDTGGYKFSSSITGSDTSFGNNVMCFNHITGGQDGIWLDRDGSRNLIIRNFGNGGQRLVFNESRCAANWFQENVAINMQESGYRSALYAGTNWSFDSRYINNVAYKCKNGIYLHKSKHNEVRNNIVYAPTDYCLIMTDSACHYGNNYFRNNFWRSTTKSTCIQYKGKAISPSAFARNEGETGALSSGVPGFVAMKSSPSDYMLKDGSVCIGSGEDGLDMGAYPIYAFCDMGCDLERTVSGIQPYIEELVTEAVRGEEHTITIRLEKAATKEVCIKLIPVAGDMREVVDYELADTVMTFLPGEVKKQTTIRFVGEESEFSKLLLLRLCGVDNTPFEGRSYTAFKLITLVERESLLHSDIYLEAENGTVGSLWQTLTDKKASGGKYVTVKSGNNSNDSAPADKKGWVSIRFEVTRPTTYILWMRTICANTNDDSFWIRLDNEEWSSWNGIPTSSQWQWNQCPRTYTMLEGEHTLHIGFREDGAKLDKLLLSCQGTIPEGMGEDVTPIVMASVENAKVVSVELYNLSGVRISRPVENGITIRQTRMSDGTVIKQKVIMKNH